MKWLTWSPTQNFWQFEFAPAEDVEDLAEGLARMLTEWERDFGDCGLH